MFLNFLKHSKYHYFRFLRLYIGPLSQYLNNSPAENGRSLYPFFQQIPDKLGIQFISIITFSFQKD